MKPGGSERCERCGDTGAVLVEELGYMPCRCTGRRPDAREEWVSAAALSLAGKLPVNPEADRLLAEAMQPAQPASTGGSFIIRALAALVHSTYREAPLSDMEDDATKELACEARREYDRLTARVRELEAQIPIAAVAILRELGETYDADRIESGALVWRDGAWVAR